MHIFLPRLFRSNTARSLRKLGSHKRVFSILPSSISNADVKSKPESEKDPKILRPEIPDTAKEQFSLETELPKYEFHICLAS